MCICLCIFVCGVHVGVNSCWGQISWVPLSWSCMWLWSPDVGYCELSLGPPARAHESSLHPQTSVILCVCAHLCMCRGQKLPSNLSFNCSLPHYFSPTLLFKEGPLSEPGTWWFTRLGWAVNHRSSCTRPDVLGSQEVLGIQTQILMLVQQVLYHPSCVLGFQTPWFPCPVFIAE